MNKTIEEAAREAVRKEYLCEKCAWKDGCDLCGGENTAFDCCECPADSYEDGFKAGAAHLMSLPLASRMTEEEKEKINRLYVDVNDKLQTCLNAKSYNQISELDNEYKKGINMGLILALKHIFGKELFGEGISKNQNDKQRDIQLQ